MSEKTLASALAAAQSTIGWAPKTGTHQQGYKYAEASVIIDAAREALSSQGIAISPSVVDVTDLEPVSTKNGGRLAHVRVTIDVTLCYGSERLSHRYIGEGMDGGDKAVCKALTAAYKYALQQILAMPTGDDPEGPSIVPAPERSRQGQPAEDLRELASELIEQLRSKGLDEPDRALRSETRRIAGPGVTITAEHITAAYDVLWAGLDGVEQDRR